jgi:predicted transcriptional regulator
MATMAKVKLTDKVGISGVVKTTVYLDRDVVQLLRVISERRSRSQAELIREALREFVSGEKPPLPEGMGMFDSGHTDTTAKRKQLLRSAARSGRWR